MTISYVFVHGGSVSSHVWSDLTKSNDYQEGTLLGGKVWDLVANGLRNQGHRVFTPTLVSEYESDLTDHIQQICQLITENNLRQINLVGHIYGGMVITGAANKIATHINSLFYIDAALPDNGQSLFDILQLANVHPNSIIKGHPKAYIQELEFNSANLDQIKKTYLLCTESEFLSVCNMMASKIKHSATYWNYHELAASHLPMATHANDLVRLLAPTQ